MTSLITGSFTGGGVARLTGGNFGAGAIGAQVYMDPSPAFVVQHFDAMGADIRSFREALKQVVKEVAKPSIESNFRAEGWYKTSYASRRTNWQELSERRKAIRGSDGPILYHSGRLYRSATAESNWRYDGGFQGGASGAGSEGAAVLARLPQNYARLMQMGGGRVPARPWAALRPGDDEKAQAIFEQWVAQRIASQSRRWRARLGGNEVAAQAAFMSGRLPSFLQDF